MPRTLAELFKEIARRASEFESPVLAHLCRMAQLEAVRSDIALDWDWDAKSDAKSNAKSDAGKPASGGASEPAPAGNISITAKPYQVWTRKGTGSYSVLVPNAKAALAAVSELSGRGHLEVVIRDMDGNAVDPQVLQVIVDLEANPTIRLVPR
jgi:hypothetical protein